MYQNYVLITRTCNIAASQKLLPFAVLKHRSAPTSCPARPWNAVICFKQKKTFVCWFHIFKGRKRKSDTLESVNRLICVYSKLESQGEKASITWEITWQLIDVLSWHWSGKDPSLIIDRQEYYFSHPGSLWVKLYTRRYKQKAFVLWREIYIYACFCTPGPQLTCHFAGAIIYTVHSIRRHSFLSVLLGCADSVEMHSENVVSSHSSCINSLV